MALITGQVTANDLELAHLSAGPDDGPLALCLHGFPDSAHSWRHLLPALADAGFHAVAPFQRGYAPTAVPADGRYQTGALATDACALHEALGGGDDAVLIGHDWGAIAAYGAASLEPARWRRVVAAAVPPMAAMAGAFLSYEQLQRSWYMFFFQHPLSDLVVPMNDLEFIDRLWADWSPGFDASAETPHVKDALRDPANLAAALGYYRAQWQPDLQVPELAAAQEATNASPPQPTLYLHGADDGCIGVGVTDGLEAFLPAEGSRVEVLDGCGHFLQVERPDELNRLVVEFVAT
jgi:pimeloyl-ACP methyl ester carboxylesterase